MGEDLYGLVTVIVMRVPLAWQTALAVRRHGIELSVLRAFIINTIAGLYGLFTPGGVIPSAAKWYKLSKPSARRAEALAAVFFIKLINTTFIVAFGISGVLLDNPFESKILTWIAPVFLVVLC